jgi:hypothetical protein
MKSMPTQLLFHSDTIEKNRNIRVKTAIMMMYGQMLTEVAVFLVSCFIAEPRCVV